jgi:hypothetical protein
MEIANYLMFSTLNIVAQIFNQLLEYVPFKIAINQNHV